MVCPQCGHVTDLTAQLLRAVRSKKALPCPKCHEADLRMRIMLYDDGEGEQRLMYATSRSCMSIVSYTQLRSMSLRCKWLEVCMLSNVR